MAVLAAQNFTVFHVLGIAFAVWALVVTTIGIRRPNFPGVVKGATERLVIAIPLVLAVATILTAAIITKREHKEPAKAAAFKAKASPRPSPNAGASAQPSQASKGSSQLKLTADPTGNLRFNTNALSAKAGAIQITLTNPSPVQHNITVQTPQGAKGGPTVGKGKTSTVLLNLKPGKYTFYCSVPGHRQAGMQGTLTVGG